MAYRQLTYNDSIAPAPHSFRPPEINAADPDILSDGITAPAKTPEHIETYKHTAVADSLVARMRRGLPDYLSDRSTRRDIDAVLETYGGVPDARVRTMRILSDAAQMRVFHDTIDALMPGTRRLERFDDPQNPERFLERVSSSLDAWAAQGKPMSGPDYAIR